MRIHKRNCDFCGQHYEGRGEHFCSVACRDTAKNGYRLIFMPDAHLEYDLPLTPAFESVLCFVKEVKPEVVVLGGDFLEMTCFSHWVKDKPKHMEGRRYKPDCKHAREQIERIAKVAKRVVYLEGNHENWMEQWLERNPSLLGTLDLREDLGLNDMGIEFVKVNKVWSANKSLHFTHGWFTNKYHANTALERYQENLFYGHTHDHQTVCRTNWSTQKPKMAMSMGCLCGKNPHFMRNKPNNWINGFGVFEVRGDGFFSPFFVPIFDGAFSYGGQIFRARG